MKATYKEIQNLTSEDVVVYGEIKNKADEVLGIHGVIFVSKEFMEQIDIYKDWELTTTFGPRCCLMFQKENGQELKIRMAVANHTTAPIEDYVDQEVVDALYDKVVALVNSKDN